MSNPALKVLVVANETLGGQSLIQAVKRKAEQAHEAGRPIDVMVVCPQNQPKHGYVVYDDTVREAAENRLETTLAQLRQAGIEATGEVMDPDPYNATTDALGLFKADEIIISTHPETRSGWMRRDLIERVSETSGLPVEHVVVDLDADRAQAVRTLVVANQTVGGEPLLGLLKGKAKESPHSFIVIVPESGEGDQSAHDRLAKTLERLEGEALEAVGQVMPRDPYTAVQNALQFYAVDEVVISTFPGERSGWLRSDLIERVKASTSKPVEHVVVSPSEAKEGATA